SPQIRVTVVVPAGTEEMLTLNPSIDEIIPLAKHQALPSQLALLLRIRRGRPDVAVNMTEGDRGAFLAAVSGARWRIGIDPRGRGFLGKRHFFTHCIQPRDDGRHRAVMDMDVLQPLGIEAGDPEVELFTAPEDDARVASLLAEKGLNAGTPYIVAHPTSRWLFKCWRDEAVAQLVDRLEGKGWRTVLTCGPDGRERAKLSNILSLVRSKPLVFPGTLTLKTLGSLIKGASVFFGVDSAPMHMAAALKTPVVALFGPSDHRVWHPLTPQGRIIVKTPEFGCIPCKQDGCQGSKRSACLEAVSVDEVFHAIRDARGA
ncbi:MAG: putative lipopolysaccharide heptosyltransferase III, partial [Syntrophobacteraceae bacterium]|nr:putative lipopolysaccharide heptosyltransferase III [Syntrophobacteraceae bacterium]